MMDDCCELTFTCSLTTSPPTAAPSSVLIQSNLFISGRVKKHSHAMGGWGAGPPQAGGGRVHPHALSINMQR